MYDASIARWNGVDALAERYGSWSAYNYVLGNPIVLVDPDGMRVSLFESQANQVGMTDEERQKRSGEYRSEKQKLAKNSGGTIRRLNQISTQFKSELDRVSQISEKENAEYNFSIFTSQVNNPNYDGNRLHITNPRTDGNPEGVNASYEGLIPSNILIVKGHTHPRSENPHGLTDMYKLLEGLDGVYTDINGNEANSLTEGLTSFVITKNKIYALVIEDVEAAHNFLKKYPTAGSLGDVYRDLTEKFVDNPNSPYRGSLGDFPNTLRAFHSWITNGSGIGFYETVNPAKTKFRKIQPVPIPKLDN